MKADPSARSAVRVCAAVQTAKHAAALMQPVRSLFYEGVGTYLTGVLNVYWWRYVTVDYSSACVCIMNRSQQHDLHGQGAD